MIRITSEAKTALNAQLTEDDAEAGQAFRFVDEGQGRIAVDKGPRKDGDIELDNEGMPVLFVPQSLAEDLGDATVDVAPAPGNGALQLVIRAGNEE